MYKKLDDRETLVRIKRWPQLLNRFQRVRIYSAEHGYYWRGTGQGYTANPLESEIWDINEAFRPTRHCGSEEKIQFVDASS